MRFVYDGNSPWNLANDVKVANQRVVRCYQDIKLEVVSSVGPILEVPLVFPHYVTPHTLPIMINAADQIRPA
jgi:hypothetical protein